MTSFALAALAAGASDPPDVFRRWIEPLGLVVMLVLGLLSALLVVRRHGRSEQRRLARAERKHPFAAPGRSLVAFGTAFASVLVFVRIARDVTLGATSSFDRQVALAVHAIDSAAVNLAMRAFTFLGSPLAVIPLLLVVFGWALRRKDYRAGAVLLLVVVMTEVLNVVLKQTFERARPTLFQGIATLHSYSFPSGHAMAAAATYGMMGVVVTRLAPKQRRLLLFGLPAFIFLIGLSRVFLGVHWPTDVLAGFAAGSFLVLAGTIALDGVPTLSDGTPSRATVLSEAPRP